MTRKDELLSKLREINKDAAEKKKPIEEELKAIYDIENKEYWMKEEKKFELQRVKTRDFIETFSKENEDWVMIYDASYGDHDHGIHFFVVLKEPVNTGIGWFQSFEFEYSLSHGDMCDPTYQVTITHLDEKSLRRVYRYSLFLYTDLPLALTWLKKKTDSGKIRSGKKKTRSEMREEKTIFNECDWWYQDEYKMILPDGTATKFIYDEDRDG